MAASGLGHGVVFMRQAPGWNRLSLTATVYRVCPLPVARVVGSAPVGIPDHWIPSIPDLGGSGSRGAGDIVHLVRPLMLCHPVRPRGHRK